MLSLALSFCRSASTFWNTAENFGRVFCSRLLLAIAMFMASLSQSISSVVKWSGLSAMCVSCLVILNMWRIRLCVR